MVNRTFLVGNIGFSGVIIVVVLITCGRGFSGGEGWSYLDVFGIFIIRCSVRDDEGGILIRGGLNLVVLILCLGGRWGVGL